MYTVKVDDLQFADLLNVARVSASNPDSNLGNNESSALTKVDHRADVGITKVASPSPAVPGAQLTYEIVVTNNGPSGVANVNFIDSLPNLLVGVTVTGSQGTCSFNGPYQIECDTGSL